MRRGVLSRGGGLAVIVGLALAAPAQAVVLVTPQGQPVGGRWQRWADRARVATLKGNLVFTPDNWPCGGAIGCSSPNGTYVSLADGPAVARDTLYFELGHQFDWHYLTSRDRRYLARKWGVPHARWRDTTKALNEGAEDGLEATFAAIYDDCAWGENDRGVGIALAGPPAPPSVLPSINTCTFVRDTARYRTARVHAAGRRTKGLAQLATT